MKKVITIALIAFFAAQGCKKCAECTGQNIGFVSATGQPIMTTFKHCDKKNPYSIENDTITMDNNTIGVDGKPATIQIQVYVTSCR